MCRSVAPNLPSPKPEVYRTSVCRGLPAPTIFGGYDFFDNGMTDDMNRTLIHELGHHCESDHLRERYHDALTDPGTRLARLAFTKSNLFREYRL